MLIVEPLVASAALALRRPVRLAMTRSEDMSATNPAGAEVLTLELGADADGILTAIRSRVFVDRGATDDFGVESIAAMLTAGPYRWRAHELTALGVATNRMTFGAYRAPDRAAGRVRGRVPDRRARAQARARPARAAPAQRRRSRAIWRRRASRSRSSARASASSASASTRSGRGATSCPRARGSASRSAGGRAGTSPPRRPAGSTPTAV